MEEKSIKVEQTARYVTLGNPSEKVKHVWFVLHGYGQLAKYFIRGFRHLESDERYIVAPEAMHRFYLSNTSGRVGASWMTKENRLQDIEDYCTYLNELANTVLREFNQPVQVHIFGFSQGVATAFRWVDHYKSCALSTLHAWAGTFPPDIDYKLNLKKFNALKMTICFGSDDEYISQENADKLMKELANQSLEIERFDYQGQHKIYPDLLKEIVEKAELINEVI